MDGKFVKELGKECLLELKREYYTELTNEQFGRFPWPDELKDIDNYVSDDEVFEVYKNTTFHKEDFDCITEGIEEW